MKWNDSSEHMERNAEHPVQSLCSDPSGANLACQISQNDMDVSSKKKSQNWTEPKPQSACKTLFSKTDFLTLSYNLVTSRQEQKTRRWVSIANSLKHSEKNATERRHGCYTRTMCLGWSGMVWICFVLSIFTLMSLRGSHFGTGFVLYPDWPYALVGNLQLDLRARSVRSMSKTK